MDPAYISAIAALVGSAIGGLTSLTATWLTQHIQFTAQQRVGNRNRRIDLYKSFIDEASKWYADAYEHDSAAVSNLVTLYALVSKMRVLSSPVIVEHADRVVRVIIQTYLAPNKTFRDVTEILDNDALNPLRDFSDACRDELLRSDLSRSTRRQAAATLARTAKPSAQAAAVGGEDLQPHARPDGQGFCIPGASSC